MVGHSHGLEDIFTRKQLKGETVEQFGRALQMLAKSVFSSDNELKDLFFKKVK